MSDEEDWLNPLNSASWWRKNLQQARTVEWVAKKEELELSEAREYLDQLVRDEGPLERIERDGVIEYRLEKSVIGGEEGTIRLIESDRLELIFPDGTTTRASSAEVGDCTVAVNSDGSLLTIFVNGTLTFKMDDRIKILSPLERSVAITDAGYVAFHTGDHRAKVFNLVSWDGEVVLQRRVQVARTPSFTPDGSYVGFWSVSNETIYCYDVETAELYGSCDSTEFSDSNISVTGVEYEEKPAFEIADSSGGTNDVVGYLAPDGTVLELIDLDRQDGGSQGTVEKPLEERTGSSDRSRVYVLEGKVAGKDMKSGYVELLVEHYRTGDYLLLNFGRNFGGYVWFDEEETNYLMSKLSSLDDLSQEKIPGQGYIKESLRDDHSNFDSALNTPKPRPSYAAEYEKKLQLEVISHTEDIDTADPEQHIGTFRLGGSKEGADVEFTYAQWCDLLESVEIFRDKSGKHRELPGEQTTSWSHSRITPSGQLVEDTWRINYKEDVLR